MRGISFVINPPGEKTAVIIDLRKHGRTWESFYQALLAEKQVPAKRTPLGESRLLRKIKTLRWKTSLTPKEADQARKHGRK